MEKVLIPSPAISIVGRHNSGKTTSIERLIAELTKRGLDIGSIKHHSHAGFDIDYPGKDSYRHRAAGATETIIAAPGQVACIKTIEGERECHELLEGMPGHDVVIVEGYRKSGLPTIEIMRSGNEADSRVAALFAQGARDGWKLGVDFTQSAQGDQIPADISSKMPTAETVAILSDIDEAIEAASLYGIEAFALDDTEGLADFVEQNYAHPGLSVVIQAGGESRRMGRSKATVPFAGRPLMCRLVERLKEVADELIITTNEPEKLGFLKEEFPDIDIKLVRDACDRRGALPGFYTALKTASNPFVAIVACDMLFASASLVVAEAEEMRKSNADVVVPVNRHGFEPFHAVYRRETCLAVVEKAVLGGENRAQVFFDKVKVLEFPHEKVLEVEPMGGCFVNANTPEELAAFEKALLG